MLHQDLAEWALAASTGNPGGDCREDAEDATVSWNAGYHDAGREAIPSNQMLNGKPFQKNVNQLILQAISFSCAQELAR